MHTNSTFCKRSSAWLARRFGLMLAALVWMVTVSATSAVAGVPGLASRFDDQLTIRLTENVAIGDFIATFEAQYPGASLSVVDSIEPWSMYLLALTPSPGMNISAVEQMLLGGEFAAMTRWAEFLYDNETPEDDINGGTGSTFVSDIAPARYTDQFIVPMLGLEAAHSRSRGQQTVVAVLDTGIDSNHPQFAGRMYPQGIDLIDNDDVPDDTGDGIDNDGDGQADEMRGHGTFVAGLVALVAPEAKILSIRVLNDDGVGDGWTLTRGIFHAVNVGADVLNFSLSSTYNAASVEDAIELASEAGLVAVAAGGNWDREDPEEYPAMRSSNIIGVAATDDFDRKAPFSNYNDKIFISAPGDSIYLGGDQPDTARSLISTLPGGDYGVWEGTSMASPLVAATAALIIAQHPEWAGRPFPEDNQDDVESVLEAAAVGIDGINPKYEGYLGVGRVDTEQTVMLGPFAPTPCEVADVNESGWVNIDDLLAVVNAFGPCIRCPEDILLSGTVNIDDLLGIIDQFMCN